MPDHRHCLFLLSPQKSIAEVIKQIKGSSSHYFNQNNLISENFAWQTGYAAYSVSESGVEKVFEYIKNQKTHHQKKTFQEEYDEFIKLYGLESQRWGHHSLKKPNRPVELLALWIDARKNKNCRMKWINPFKYHRLQPIAHGFNRWL